MNCFYVAYENSFLLCFLSTTSSIFPPLINPPEVQHMHFNGEYIKGRQWCLATQQNAKLVNHSSQPKQRPIYTLYMGLIFNLCKQEYTPCICLGSITFSSASTIHTEFYSLLEISAKSLTPRSVKSLSLPTLLKISLNTLKFYLKN